MISVEDAKIQLEYINEYFEMNFEDIIKDLLLDGEAMSYSPYEEDTKDEVQRKLIKEFIEHEDEIKLEKLERAKYLEEIINNNKGE